MKENIAQKENSTEAIPGRLFNIKGVELYSKGNIIFLINRILTKAVFKDKTNEFSNRAEVCKSYGILIRKPTP